MAETVHEAPTGAESATEEFVPPRVPKGKRFAGYCRKCHAFVDLDANFTCEKGGHPKDDIAVALLIGKKDPLPKLPRVNWGALFMPALWGPVHGHWFMILMYPVWLFMDNMIYSAVHGTTSPVLAVLASVMLAAFTIFYALRANEVGYLQVAADKSPEDYVKGERKWTALFVLMGIAFIAFASWYNLEIRPTLPME